MEDKILTKIEIIEIKYIRSVVPQLLYKKLVGLKIMTIKDILDTSTESFESKKGVGLKAARLFRNLKEDIVKNPSKYSDIYLRYKETILPLNLSGNNNLIENIKLFINDYKDVCDDARNIDVLFKKYGLGTEVFTLEEIGTFYDLTRERIRQIKETEIGKIKNLFNGKTINKPFCKCRKEFIEQTSDLLSLVGDKSTISYHGINALFKDKYASQISYDDINYLSFLFSVFGFDTLTYLSNHIYYKSEKYSNQTLNQLLKTIQKVLEINIYPIDPFSIVVKVKKVLKNPSITNSDILNILNQVIEFEKIIVKEKEYYQLRIDLLSTAGDMGMRILNENKQSMHFNDLVRIVNQKLLQYNSSKLITPDSLKVQFISSPYTIASGKTGYWSLKEWETDSNTILSLIKSALFSRNSPLTYTEIFEHIASKRPEIKKESIRSIISINKNEFLKLNDKRFIIKDWSNKYRDQLLTNPTALKKSYDDMQIMLQIAKIFEENSTNCLSTVSLRNLLKKSGIVFKDSTYRFKLARFPILEEKLQRSRKVLLKHDYKSVLGKIPSKDEKTTKAEVIKKEIFAILKKNNNMILQSKLIKTLKNEFGFPRGTVYKIFQTDGSFKKQFDDNLRTYISVNISENEKEIIDNELALLLQSNENDTLEFKSSFRWDIKENKINKDLEYEVIKSIAAFLNSSGGNLLIGVDDFNNILGLEADFKTFYKKNPDGFQLHLLNVVQTYFPKDIHIYFKILFPIIDSKTICHIKIAKSDVPRFIKRDGKSVFLIRASGSSQHLDIDEAYNYIKSHWQKI